ncbi:lysophospholipid acyltransferase family protein [Corynebacterium glyciniphilum]|uniref:Putative phospholipid/glycerol acyltransferase n=1 Tax=Corynebacterium glyciniphilum AJ 3170 TaxID=1404245 RepID=X5DK75_9CORY|nr:lysophospholipid acyltransferase family protein [Corynebacterium glyciniphilum]AHW63508.1 Putative phospholipid/glycerol acyltransferase [Corynebacterium glyciniphilum AJ 3170]
MSNEMSWAARAIITRTNGTVAAPRQRRRTLYDLVKNMILWIFYLQNIRIEIEGAENIPLTGGVILAPNHRAYYDVIPVSGPLQLRGDRKPRYMLKKEAFVNRWISKLFVELGGIAVDRAPGKGRESLSAAVDALQDGEVVAVFPQGTIRHDKEIGELKSGAVRMAARSGAVIVPVGCSGTQKLWTRGERPRLGGRRVTVYVVVGEPITVDGKGTEGTEGTEEMDAGTSALRARLQSVKDRADEAAMRRTYAGR